MAAISRLISALSASLIASFEDVPQNSAAKLSTFRLIYKLFSVNLLVCCKIGLFAMGLVLSSGGVFTVWEYDIENFTFFYLNFMVEEG
ncbi:MAG: hypothetical protein K2I35_02645, partial [Duncaniella sp.]|nr:hypothetical protein [Duncaniella sp.]